jgi:1-acyl-sn-glycerol-3-phosphate acyltransferase
MPAFYRFCWTVLRILFRVFLGLRAEGLESLPRGGCLLAANHKSYLDPPVIGTCVHRAIHYLAKEELCRTGWEKAFFSAIGVLPIRRGRPTAGQLKACLDVLSRGRFLVVFPEGTRIRRKGLGPPRSGVGFLVRRAGVPVVPVYVEGTFPWWRALVRRPRVTVRFGTPMAFTEDADDIEVGRDVLQAIASLGDLPGNDSQEGD